MSSTLTSSADTAKKAKALVQIATAVCNVQGIAHKITNFSKAVFGEQDTEAAISAKKQEQARK
ncbi:hypothetical protein Tdes44962_MAKER03272 [Teratosphaeria destructans]|uniref:Uncharacterized protein n=1 Tax=Teratosphaeria destructans TaxID=418781 RepID=A0A9W7W1Z9_9PEZI|nr:hypothetical protein Tdes44962_MAKER03272 [Teratosphaeria destructans]